MIQDLLDQVVRQDVSHSGLGAELDAVGGNGGKYGLHIIRDHIFPAV